VNDARVGARSARYYVRVLRRRAWIVILAAVLGLGLGVLYSKHQHKLMRAQAAIAVNTQAFLTTASSSGKSDAARFIATEASIATSPHVATLAVQNSKVKGWTAAKLLKSSSVVADPSSNVVHFTVSAPSKTTAMALVNAYATAAAAQNLKVAVNQVDVQLAPIQTQIKAIQGKITAAQAAIDRATAAGQNTSSQEALVRTLADRQDSLLKLQQGFLSQRSLLEHGEQVSNVSAPATGAAQIQPTTTRNLAAGLAVGLLVGLGLAFLLEVMDARARSSEDVISELGVPLLGRVPAPPRRLRSSNQLVLLADSGSIQGESFRKLRVSFDLANLDVRARTVMVTSAVDQEGKTTTVANLAIALAQVGRRVALVDLDLRRPNLVRYFGLDLAPGISDVANGHATLDDSLRSVALTSPRPSSRQRPVTSTNGSGSAIEGTLHVLPAGRQVRDPAAFLESDAMKGVLEQLSERFDLVLLDAPPTLPVSDARALMRKVDAAFVVCRLEVVNRQMLHEFRRELAGTQTVVLGVVVTAADADDEYAYGYGYGYGAGPQHVPDSEQVPVSPPES
jgi:Mrp family chromosome partitioning ATPase/capsular polysaccharide biosynthesis protein